MDTTDFRRSETRLNGGLGQNRTAEQGFSAPRSFAAWSCFLLFRMAVDGRKRKLEDEQGKVIDEKKKAEAKHAEITGECRKLQKQE